MKFEGSGSKGTRVIERKRSVTDGYTARRTDGQGKIKIKYWTYILLIINDNFFLFGT